MCGFTSLLLRRLQKKYNFRTNSEETRVFVKNDKFVLPAIAAIIIRTILNAFLIASWVYSFKYAKLACIDEGVMTAILHSNVAFQWIVGYFLFNESMEPS